MDGQDRMLISLRLYYLSIDCIPYSRMARHLNIFMTHEA